MQCAGADTLDRFIWVLGFLARNDFVVVPVDQLQFDDSVLADRHTWGKVSGTCSQLAPGADAGCSELGEPSSPPGTA